jgi:hypothetical protein
LELYHNNMNRQDGQILTKQWKPFIRVLGERATFFT